MKGGRLLGCGVLVVIGVFAWASVFNISRAAPLEIRFLNVGEGDAVFIKIGSFTTVLIDGGPGKKVLEKIPQGLFLKPGLDLAVLTHPDKDHSEGLISVLKNRRVGNLYWTGVKREAAFYSSWEETLEKENVRQRIAVRGQIFRAGKTVVRTLHPGHRFRGEKVEHPNNTSIVQRARFGKTSFLFTGDVPAEKEAEIINRGEVVNSDVLKVAHHGSGTSSSPVFLGKVSPEIAVIQTGGREFRHPNKKVLKRLENTGARVLRTDKEGDISILSDGKHLIINH